MKPTVCVGEQDTFLPSLAGSSFSQEDTNKITQMRIRLSSLASVCDRTGISDRAAVSIASATLQDFGRINSDDKSKMIYWMKIRRERAKNQKKCIEDG
ncbi:hypothetical protein AVEN_14577-1 [Araneus ventricosus]|uniref:Uncharacterized protein n=1 Tax=Araneus ventricosus TaxID=182803 RepID=A0A4Y2CGU4_ARAVE|nr:hypothetical protein AVEN_14577-1 [Araneus ventricosus]